jgi:hypothetical protein
MGGLLKKNFGKSGSPSWILFNMAKFNSKPAGSFIYNLLTPALTTLLTVSCAHEKMYSGPKLPDEQLATLEATAPMWLVSVDGHKMSSIGLRDTVRVKILPGPHNIEVSYNSTDIGTGVDKYGNFARMRQETWSGKNFPLTFTAKAGYRYVAHAGRIGISDWEPFISESLAATNRPTPK